MSLKLASSFGIDIFSASAQKELDQFLSALMQSVGDVVELVTNLHTAITHTELKASNLELSLHLLRNEKENEIG